MDRDKISKRKAGNTAERIRKYCNAVKRSSKGGYSRKEDKE